MDKTQLLKRIERIGKVPPSGWHIGHVTECKQLLRDLYRYIRDEKTVVENLKESEVRDLFTQ